jgi:hypothetical protein
MRFNRLPRWAATRERDRQATDCHNSAWARVAGTQFGPVYVSTAFQVLGHASISIELLLKLLLILPPPFKDMHPLTQDMHPLTRGGWSLRKFPNWSLHTSMDMLSLAHSRRSSYQVGPDWPSYVLLIADLAPSLSSDNYHLQYGTRCLLPH